MKKVAKIHIDFKYAEDTDQTEVIDRFYQWLFDEIWRLKYSKGG